MKKKILLALLLTTLCIVLTVGYVYAASISADLTILQGGAEVVEAGQGSTVTLHSSFTISPVSTATGQLYYKYSAVPLSEDDPTWASITETTITTYTGWNGVEKTLDFTMPDAGYYIFFLTVTKGLNTATTYYPASGTFHSNPLSVLPEAPPVVAVAASFVAIGVCLAVVKKKGATVSAKLLN